MRFSSKIALWAIAFYRKRLSPIKGYRCAAGALGRSETCSAVGLRIFKKAGLLKGYALLGRQFDRCAIAADELRSARQAESFRTEPSEKKASPRSRVLSKQRGFVDCGGCDAPSCDIPSCDLPDVKCPSCDMPSMPSCDMPSCGRAGASPITEACGSTWPSTACDAAYCIDCGGCGRSGGGAAARARVDQQDQRRRERREEAAVADKNKAASESVAQDE